MGLAYQVLLDAQFLMNPLNICDSCVWNELDGLCVGRGCVCVLCVCIERTKLIGWDTEIRVEDVVMG